MSGGVEQGCNGAPMGNGSNWIPSAGPWRRVLGPEFPLHQRLPAERCCSEGSGQRD